MVRVCRTIVKTYKNQPCIDCGNTYPSYVMDFDHVRGTKKASLSKLVERGSLIAVVDEIAKCEVVCANCHRERTFSKGQHLSTYVRETTIVLEEGYAGRT